MGLALLLMGRNRSFRSGMIQGPKANGAVMDWKLELVPVPVSDVDVAKASYTEKLGFHEDIDQQVNENIRFIQLTPPGSACSISIGTGLVDSAPGSTRGLQVVVDDVKAAH